MTFKRDVCPAMASAGSASQTENPLPLLFFGNSFTQGGSSQRVADWVGALAVADGHVAPIIVADLMGGRDLNYHLEQIQNYPPNNVTNSALPEGKTWDYVIIQGYSTEATSLNRNAFDRDALTLYTAVANHSSGNGKDVATILYQTWARWDLIHQGKFDGNMDTMQAAIATGYKSAYNAIAGADASCGIAAVGEAFGLLDYDTSLYGDDDYHASSTGYMLAAMVLYRTIYGETVSGIEYDGSYSNYGISESTWAKLVATADAAPISPTP